MNSYAHSFSCPLASWGSVVKSVPGEVVLAAHLNPLVLDYSIVALGTCMDMYGLAVAYPWCVNEVNRCLWSIRRMGSWLHVFTKAGENKGFRAAEGTKKHVQKRTPSKRQLPWSQRSRESTFAARVGSSC